MTDSIDICTLGELLIDLFPQQTGVPLAQVPAFHPVPGGAPANVAVGCARLGKRSAFMGKVGNDPFGHFLENTLAQAGVNTQGVRFDSTTRTTLAFIAKPDEQTADILFYRHPGADMMLQVSDLDLTLLQKSRMFHFGSISLTRQPSGEATLEAARYAHEHGALLSFDVNYRPDVWDDTTQALSVIVAGFRGVDLLKVNQAELALLTGTDQLDRGSLALLDQGPRLIVVTLGEAGSYFRTSSAFGTVPAFTGPVLDTTGCGDAFLAALLSGLVETPDWESEDLFPLLRRANAAGAITAGRWGVIPALPTRIEVDEFLKTYRE